MRSPAQPRPGLAAARGQALLYTNPLATAVLHNNDGGQGGGPGTPPAGTAPSPADLAARSAQQPPAAPQNPAQAAPPAPSPEDEKVSLTQRRLNVIMRDEKEEGRRSAFRTVAEAAGLDPDTFDPAAFGDIFKKAEQARQQQLSEEQRRAEELQRREQAIQADQTKLEQERAALKASQATLVREQALIRLGAVDVSDDHGTVTAPNLQDALAMLERDLRDTPDIDAAAVATAAEALKKRRPELFGAAPAPQTLPPAPSGGPAGGNAPRQPSGSKDAVREAARKRAEAMGLRQAG